MGDPIVHFEEISKAQAEHPLTLFELNNLIERLIGSNGSDAEAREGVVKFVEEKMRFSRLSSFHIRYTEGPPSSGFKGYTNEMGNVPIPAPQERSVKRLKFEEDNALKIGNYILSRYRDGIGIQDFWKSGVSSHSNTEQPEAWLLKLNKERKPEWFGARATEPIWDIGIPHVFRYAATNVYFVELWGEKIDSVHFAGPENLLTFG